MRIDVANYSFISKSFKFIFHIIIIMFYLHLLLLISYLKYRTILDRIFSEVYDSILLYLSSKGILLLLLLLILFFEEINLRFNKLINIIIIIIILKKFIRLTNKIFNIVEIYYYRVISYLIQCIIK